MSKKKILLLIVLLLSILFIIVFVYLVKDIQFGYDKKTCFNIPETAFPDHNDSSILKCIGYMYIERDNKCNNDVGEIKCGDIFIYNTDKSELAVAKVNEYKIFGDNIYVIGKPEVSILISENKKYTFINTKNSGTETSTEISDLNNLPKYIILNYKTSDINLYKDISETPSEASLIFKELEKNKK